MNEKQFIELKNAVRFSITILLAFLMLCSLGGTITTCYLIYASSSQSIVVENKTSKHKTRLVKVTNATNLKRVKIIDGNNK